MKKTTLGCQRWFGLEFRFLTISSPYVCHNINCVEDLWDVCAQRSGVCVVFLVKNEHTCFTIVVAKVVVVVVAKWGNANLPAKPQARCLNKPESKLLDLQWCCFSTQFKVWCVQRSEKRQKEFHFKLVTQTHPIHIEICECEWKSVICLIKRTLVFTWKAIMRFEQNRQNECEFFLRNAMPAVHFPSRSAAPPQIVPFPRQRRVYICPACPACSMLVLEEGNVPPFIKVKLCVHIQWTTPTAHPQRSLGRTTALFTFWTDLVPWIVQGLLFGTTVTFTRLTVIEPGLCGVHANVFIKFSKTLSWSGTELTHVTPPDLAAEESTREL